jgi:2-desacetyl-2-hydroxyethyl bacteriochlorophyllide A dehydrogenase
MKTAVFYGGPDIRLEDRSVPAPAPGEVLVRIRAAGICGSDLRHYRRQVSNASYPLTGGHELSGEVIATGPGVTQLGIGTRVGIEPLHLIGCGECQQCRAGAPHICPRRGQRDGQPVHSSGFSELDTAPVTNVYPVPDTVSFEAAALLDVYGVAVHGAHRVPIRPADAVVVIGTGAVGLSQGQVARALGARQVILVGRRAQPLALALDIGAADSVVDSSQVDPVQAVLDITQHRGADVVFETSGTAAGIQLGCELVGFGGRLGISGLYPEPAVLDTTPLMRKEVAVCWVNSYSSWDGVPEYQIALELLASGRIAADNLVTHRVPLADIARGFALADNKSSSGSIKVMVMP